MQPITYSHARNPKWVDAAKTRIELEVNFDHIQDEEYSPCAVIDLSGVPGEEHITELWNRAKAGDFGEMPEFEVPEDWDRDETLLRFHIRRQRDELLRQSDYAIASDIWEDMSAEEKQSWKDYRQALRDVPQNWTRTASYDTETDTFRLSEEYEFPQAPGNDR